MLLFHGHSFGSLRRELVERVGMDRAREMFTRPGYQQGVDDSERTRNVTGGDVADAWLMGPPLREIEGFVCNDPIGPLSEALQFNPEHGRFFGNFYWSSSLEAEAHLNHIGISGVPACWLMIGYATGYTTALMGRPILWREQECVAMGHKRCHVVGRPLEEWTDTDEDLRFFQIENFVAAPRPRSAARKRQQPEAAPQGFIQSSFGELVGASAAFNAVVHLLRLIESYYPKAGNGRQPTQSGSPGARAGITVSEVARCQISRWPTRATSSSTGASTTTGSARTVRSATVPHRNLPARGKPRRRQRLFRTSIAFPGVIPALPISEQYR
jgi:hypothetical protein